MKTGPKPKPIEELFWSKVRRGVGCWEWTGAKANGYGALVHVVNRKQKHWIAHRLSWTLTHGPIPDGVFICHTCDNPGCVNPDHLFVGSAQTNATDMARKWRSTFGEKNPQAKLNEREVLRIRFLRKHHNWTYKMLAKEFGMTISPIRDVCKHRTWQFI